MTKKRAIIIVIDSMGIGALPDCAEFGDIPECNTLKNVCAFNKGLDVPVLASNAIDVETGKAYFQEYVIQKRNGIKFAIIGFTQPNIENAYAQELWEGMDFESLYPDFTQNVVDRVRAEENPDVVIVVIHSGAGRGDGQQLEQQGLDLFNSLKGVDYLVSSHDHRAAVLENESMAFVNTGNYCANLGYGTITVTVEKGKVVGRKASSSSSFHGMVLRKSGTRDSSVNIAEKCSAKELPK